MIVESGAVHMDKNFLDKGGKLLDVVREALLS